MNSKKLGDKLLGKKTPITIKNTSEKKEFWFYESGNNSCWKRHSRYHR